MAIVRATLRVIGGAIEDIAARFYATMFAEHPDLRRNCSTAATRPTANSAARSPLARTGLKVSPGAAATLDGGLIQCIDQYTVSRLDSRPAIDQKG
ncbi:hypothetical protein [Nonomuraea sp. NPDC049695]|uniref:hypothetical protein n=1 Tax=Nonomuraea sp. NPDC049695 TaxID=3154734 RepID=UPI0034207A17